MEESLLYYSLPEEVRDVLDTFDEQENGYKECKRISLELNKIGWDMNYGLDGYPDLESIERLK